MKIREVSDLHLEFHLDSHHEDSRLILPELYGDEFSVLILAGDCFLVHKAKHIMRGFMKSVSERFRAVIVVLGNHEHYNGSLVRTKPKLCAELNHFKLDNVHVLDNDVHVIDDVAFIGTTMWTSMDNHNPMCMMDAAVKLNDFRVIRTGTIDDPYKTKFTPSHAISEFVKARQFIFDNITEHREKQHKVVVITHHAPSWQSTDPRYVGDCLNGAYLNNLDDMIWDNGPDLWFHGHVHSSFNYDIGDTRVVCNPHGYYGMTHDVNEDFLPNMVHRL